MDAYSEGFKDRLRGEPLLANPHDPGTPERDRWASGWTDQDHHLRERDAALDSIGWFGR